MIEIIIILSIMITIPLVIMYFTAPTVALWFDKKFFLSEPKYQHGLIGDEYCIIIENLTDAKARVKMYSSYDVNTSIIDVSRITFINVHNAE